MSLSSPKVTFNNRLLSVEELFRQRQFGPGIEELAALSENEFDDRQHEHGLYLSLTAEAAHHQGDYRRALKDGLRAAQMLADYPLNKRYGRIQLVLSKAYSSTGDLKNADIRARDALASFRRASDERGQIDSLNELGRLAFMRCDYVASAGFLADALSMVTDDTRKRAQLTGNLGRIRTFTGDWKQAEEDLRFAYDYSVETDQEISQAINLLSLGYLALRRRQFAETARLFDRALEIITRLDLKREKAIYLEYAGELALEKGDLHRAKGLLNEAYQEGMLLAPGSALVSQSGRRLAQVELLLDNVDDAMKYAQKALDLALNLGERAEVAVARRVIAEIFLARGEQEAAKDYVTQAMELLETVGDPYELGLAMLVAARVQVATGATGYEKVAAHFDRAQRLFKKLGIDYLVAECDYRAGVLACQEGDLSTGFKKLSRAERVFSHMNDKPKLLAVGKFLRSLSEQAVALSVSEENGFKIFGNLITPDEYTNLKSSQLEDILQILLNKSGGDRALVYTPDADGPKVVATFSMTGRQEESFREGFRRLLGQEFSDNRPTLMLDCRRDPFVNQLFPHVPTVVASVVVVPFKLSDGQVSYLYVDRFSDDNRLAPFSQSELNFIVGFSDFLAFKWTEFEKNRLAEDNRRLMQQLREKSEFPNIITQSQPMLEMLAQVRQVVDSNISVSITGETGSGKDLLARAIHYNSNRRDKRFISVNCAALPETLLESELFGYKRGAFTGADRDKAGLFEEADGGTFFLDEIADMPLSIQAKILRVLEEKEIVRLGETVPRKVDVRIVSATNKDLKVEMADKRFRQDLYYRLSALTFRLPPLRERKEDIPLLVEHFLRESGKTVSPEVMKSLMAYEWPGNVRELYNEIKKLALLAGERTVIDVDLLSGRLALAGESPVAATQGSTPSLAEEVNFSEDYSLYDYLSTYEKRFIIQALKKKRGVKKHAAALLSIPESTLRLKIKQYGIDLKNLDAVH